ncbi:MBOAT family protein [Faecalibacterium prausnitzii]|jgi:alginate O-acetyltransferase complex protein AlgI|uniref:MBOAT family O-acyltransferase n=1 Tax=Faecalibacterium TaxID=216851 RepID=UPI00122CB7E8|nr:MULTISPECIES: MBOAT family protein [Faecalibacterium]
MVFSSVIFLCLFLPIVLGGYYLLPKREAKNLWLIAASLLFYAFSGLWYVLLLLFSVFCNYLAGLFVSGRKGVLYVAVAVNLGVLGVFKYLTFLVRTVNQLPGVAIAVPSIVLPVGISFFTFQGLSYVIDVYRNERLKSTRFRDVLLYIALFPQLVAGPIVRYEDVADEIKSRRHTLEQLANGLRRFIIGLSKKLMIADVCGSVVTLIYSAKSSALDSRTAWLAAVCYLIQIYFDFSGYSDMAIGLGLCFGFHFKENFNYPYISASIQEFWRRWHISLSTWFREYLYIPLGGNRKGKAKTYRNKLMVFFCTGLWHGANWTFIIWGLWHGFFIVAEDAAKKLFGLGKHGKNRRNPVETVLKHLYTLLVVLIGFVIFRADNMGQAFSMIGAMFSGIRASAQTGLLLAQCLTPLTMFALLFGLVGSTPVLPMVCRKAEQQTGSVYVCLRVLSYVGALILLLVDILHLSAASYVPFIYFQF